MQKIIIGEKVNTEGYSGLALACMKRYNTFVELNSGSGEGEAGSPQAFRLGMKA